MWKVKVIMTYGNFQCKNWLIFINRVLGAISCTFWAQKFNQLEVFIFRSFKFTLKPPNIIAHWKFWLAFWDTSFWTNFSNLNIRDLETYPRICSGHFWNMSLFDDSRTISVLFRKSKFSLWRSDRHHLIGFIFRNTGP